MLERDHLHRLRNVWVESPVYFLTACTAHRHKILAKPLAASILTQSWHAAPKIHGWVVGRYVVMPDHVHFFAAARRDAKVLSAFMRDWKRWTARKIVESEQINPPIWQVEFFDHVLRSARSYSLKWDYIRENPVRAGLVASAETWSYAGECVSLS
ncbi:MAG: transposase [Opitutaceae bacterium]